MLTEGGVTQRATCLVEPLKQAPGLPMGVLIQDIWRKPCRRRGCCAEDAVAACANLHEVRYVGRSQIAKCVTQTENRPRCDKARYGADDAISIEMMSERE